MKRSEMERYIELILENELGSSWNGYSTLAAYLLLKLEEKGMQPPTITVMKNTYNRADGTYGFDANEWEPEDEKK